MSQNASVSVSMQCRANGDLTATIHKNTPLTLYVSITNDGAMQAASYNSSLELQRQELSTKLSIGKLTEREYKRSIIELDRKKQEVKVYWLADETSWAKRIRFEALSKTTWNEINWPLKIINSYPSGAVAQLDATSMSYAEFGLIPSDSTKPLKGEFQIRATIEIVVGKVVKSNPVSITILDEAFSPKEAKEEQNLLVRATYDYKRAAYDEARTTVSKILEGNPSSLDALTLLGDIEEASENLKQALAAYERALEEFYKQQGNTVVPRQLIGKINRLHTLIGG